MLITNFPPISSVLNKLILVFLALHVQHAIAQNEEYNIDSMARLFVHSESVDIKTFDLLFRHLNQQYPEELAHLGEVLLKKSIGKQYADGIYRAHDAFGFYFMSKGYYDFALKLLLRSKKHYEETDNLVYKMKNYYYIGRVYVGIGNLADGILWCEKSLELAEDNPDRSSLYTLRTDLATLYFRNNNYPQGILLLDKNQAEWPYLNKQQKTELLTLQGNYLIHHKKNQEAKKKYDQALEIALQTNNQVLIATTNTNLGIYEFEYDINKSKAYFLESLRCARLSSYANKISLDHFNLGFWYLGAEDIDSAVVHFESSYEEAKKINLYSYMLDALQELIGIERGRANWSRVDELHNLVADTKTNQYNALIQSYEDLALFDNLNLLKSEDNQTLDFRKNKLFGLESWIFWLFIILMTIIAMLSTALIILIRHKRPINDEDSLS